MTHLLIISHDVVGERMAGPGIRYWEMARALGRQLMVTLATPGTSLAGSGFNTHEYAFGDWQTLAPAVSQADALLLSGDLLMYFTQLAECGKPLIIEASYPYTFEALQLGSSQPREQQMAGYLSRLEAMRRAGRAGDFFFCANERQRSYWLGVLDSLGRINPDTYAEDNSFHRFIDIVPFALPSRPPKRTGPAMKGVIPGIGPDDEIVLWGGGLWQWLDPLTLVRAIARVSERRPQVRLVFPATRHPNPTMPDMPMRQQAEDLSDQLGLAGQTVFFGDWVPYEEWPNYLLEADVGASLHLETLETHFAFRTRMLDYIWAGLPMVVTGGDSTSELVKTYGLGEVVPPDDAEAVAAAIHHLLETPNLRDSYRPRFDEIRPHFTWERACEPIVHFCQNPCLAPDRAAGTIPSAVDKDVLAERDAEVARLRSQVVRYEAERSARAARWTGRIQHHLSESRPVRFWRDQRHTCRFYRQLSREVGLASNHAFVDRAYWRILGRAPDKEGFEHFADSLDQGERSRWAVVASLVASPEFRTQPRRVLGLTETLHLVRCQLVSSLPRADHILDLGGAAPYSIQGSLLVMGYPHRVQSLTIVDLPPSHRQGDYPIGDREQAGIWIETEMGPIRYLHVPMFDLSAISSSSIDLVFAGQSIEHVSVARGLQTLREAFRVLRPGGRLCVDTPNAAITRIQSPSLFLNPEHKVEYRVDELASSVQEVGFEIVEIKGICPMPDTRRHGVFDEQELMSNAHLSEDAENSYLFYVQAVKQVKGKLEATREVPCEPQ